MSRGAKLIDIEKGQILAYHNENYSAREIEREINRLDYFVKSYLKSYNTYRTKKSPGRPKNLQAQDLWR